MNNDGLTEETHKMVAARSSQMVGFNPLVLNPNDRRARAQRLYTHLLESGKFPEAETFRQLELSTPENGHVARYSLIAAGNGAALEYDGEKGVIRMSKGSARVTFPVTPELLRALGDWLNEQRYTEQVRGGDSAASVAPNKGYFGGKMYV